MFKGFLYSGILASLSIFGASPSSTNFTLKSYDLGGGGSGQTSSTNYILDGSAGTQTGDGSQNSTNYKLSGGELATQNANVPPAPSFTNPSSEYDRLKLVINTGSNPTDTKFQVAISTDNFVTTKYVQTDNTISTSNTIATYQTYASWGSATGVWVVGLDSGTTYTVKVRALQGNFSGSPYGPTATAATIGPSLTFSVATSLTGTPPFAIAFTSLPAGSVVSGNATADIGLSTNSLNGGTVYVKSSAGLTSAVAASTIASATADLSVAGSGYGAIISSVAQVSGGPFAGVAPYNGVSNNVGALLTSLQPILSTGAPMTSGTATITLKAKTNSTTPSAGDYSDTLTFIAAMLY